MAGNASSESNVHASIGAVDDLLDRLWAGEVEIVESYLRQQPSRPSDIRWATVQAWRSFVDANLWGDGMALAAQFAPKQSQSPDFIVRGRELYMKWRAHDVFASLVEEWTGESLTGFDLCAQAAVAGWGTEGRALDALLAGIRPTAHPEADAVIRMAGETGLGMCYALGRGHADERVRSAMLNVLHETCQRYSFGRRELIEAAEGTTEVPMYEAKGMQWGEEMLGISDKPYVSALAVGRHLLKWRLALRNEQFGKPLGTERLAALLEDPPTLTVAQIGEAARFAV